MHHPRRPGLACLALLLSAAASADEPPPTTVPPRPISDSVDRVVERLEKEREDPCQKARAEGRPCFPVSTVIRGAEGSVRESLRIPLPEGPSPNRPPTADEMAPYRPGPKALVIPFATFDPGCVAKSALKKLKGKNDVYYLYRIRDVHGERVALYDHRLVADAFQGDVEFLGKFDGECDALAAYRHEDQKSKPRANDLMTMPRPRPSPSPAPSPGPSPASR